MAQKLEVYKICKSCEGTGILTFYDFEGNYVKESITCPRCLGEKEILWGNIADLNDKLDDIIDKLNDIKEVVDAL